MSKGETIVERLGDIPLVNDGWTSAVDCYVKVKDYNSVTRFTLGVAETSVKKAAEISSPVVGQYKTQIDSVNTYACNKLEELETKYPLIKQPSGEVKDACLEYVEPVVSKVKPVVSCVSSVVETSKRQVNAIKETSSKLVTGARDLSVSTVTGAVNLTLATPPGRLLTRTMDGALDLADGLMDRYIQEEDQDNIQVPDENVDVPVEAVNNLNNVPQMEIMEPSPERVVMHFRSVSNKLRRRMFYKAMKDYQGAKVRTFDALGKLSNHVNLIEYARTNFDQAKEKASDVWDKIKEEERDEAEENANGSEQAGMLEDKIIRIGRVLMHQVRSGVEILENITEEAGHFVKNPVSKSQEYKDLFIQFNLTHSLTDMSKATLESIRSNLRTVSQNLRSMIDSFKVPEWMSVDVDVANLDLDDEDLINNSLRAPEQPEIIGNHVDG